MKSDKQTARRRPVRKRKAQPKAKTILTEILVKMHRLDRQYSDRGSMNQIDAVNLEYGLRRDILALLGVIEKGGWGRLSVRKMILIDKFAAIVRNLGKVSCAEDDAQDGVFATHCRTIFRTFYVLAKGL